MVSQHRTTMWQEQRQLLLKVVKEAAHDGLVSDFSGNASMRLAGELVLITPSRRPYSQMHAEDLIVMDMEGEPVEETLMPSSEAHLHLSIYKTREDVGAVLHTHSVFGSVAAVAGLPIPAIVDEMVMALGGEVRVADYGFPGTEELSRNALNALADGNAVLLRNHGVIGVGTDPLQALEVCRLVERVAQIFIHASILGRAFPLPTEMVEVERSLFLMQREAQASRGGDDADCP